MVRVRSGYTQVKVIEKLRVRVTSRVGVIDKMSTNPKPC